MKFWQKNRKCDLSVIVILYNMRRESRRTLYSLTRKYQQNTEGIEYEIIVIDNGSSEPINSELLDGLEGIFRYIYFDAHTPSPCEALNYGAQIARGKLVMFCIDGARILSPGILHYTMLASKLHENSFIYTLGMHIGHKPQNYLAEENYSQKDEDTLIDSVEWKRDGYSLFDISSAAFSSGNGYFSKLTESNCVTMLRSTYQKIGGFDERFKSAGGGLVNLDFFNRIHKIDDIWPIMLLGEATFHQFHGGTATNVPMKDHPWGKMIKEYESIHGKTFVSFFRPPTFLGNVHPRCYKLLALPIENS